MEIAQSACWFDSNDPAEREGAEEKIRNSIKAATIQRRLHAGPIEWRVIEPDSDELAVRPPKGSPLGVKCLIGEAKTAPGYYLVKKASGFTHELESKDLERLRAATRRALDICYPHDKDRSNMRVDAIINELGPETAPKTLGESI